MKNLIAEMLVQPWAMEPKALEAFVARVNDATRNVDSPKAFFGDEPPPKRKGMSITGSVARIPVSGTLLKRVPNWMRWFGFDATSYADIADDVRAAVADASVKEIVLVVGSPGGQVAGVHEAGEAILAARDSGKQVTAEVEDLCASAAYWLASQAHRIVAGPNAQVGSIGVYSVYVDSSKAAEEEGFKVHVVSSGPHKGAGVPGAKITEEQLAGFQAVIDGMAENFKAAVARGRGRARKDSDQWATGQVWLAGDAARMGMIDQLMSTPRNEGAAGVRPAAEHTNLKAEEETMADEKALQEERKRATDIAAAFPKHPAFAKAQIEKGASLIEAKAAFVEVLQAENDAANTALATAEQKLETATRAKGPVGADPVALGGQPSGADLGTHPFMALVEERMRKNGNNRLEAMSFCASRNRELYRDWEGKADAKALARKEGVPVK